LTALGYLQRPWDATNLNRQIRKSIKTRGHFPDEQAATKLI
jgi:transposase-like protein